MLSRRRSRSIQSVGATTRPVRANGGSEFNATVEAGGELEDIPTPAALDHSFTAPESRTSKSPSTFRANATRLPGSDNDECAALRRIVSSDEINRLRVINARVESFTE
jgi:hypothetical protein